MSKVSKRTVCRCDEEAGCQLMAQQGRKNPIAIKLAFWKLPSGWCLAYTNSFCCASLRLVTFNEPRSLTAFCVLGRKVNVFD